MPSDYLTLAALLLGTAIVLLVVGAFAGPAWGRRARIGCGVLGVLSAAIVSMVMMMLSAMAQAHGSGTPSWYPFALGAVPLAMAVGAFALIVASGRHRVAVMGCGGLMILTGVGVLLLTMLSSPH